MIDIERYFNLIRPWAKGCPEPGMHDALVEAAREFAFQTRIVRRTVAITLQANLQTYAMGGQSYVTQPLDQEEEAIDILSCQIKDQQNNIWSLQPGDPQYWNPFVQPGPPWQYVYTPVSQASFWQIPDTTYFASLVVSTQPRTGASAISDELMRPYSAKIADGALARILAVKNRPWSAPEQVAMREANFQSGISDARSALIRNFTAGSYRAKPRPYIV